MVESCTRSLSGLAPKRLVLQNFTAGWRHLVYFQRLWTDCLIVSIAPVCLCFMLYIITKIFRCNQACIRTDQTSPQHTSNNFRMKRCSKCQLPPVQQRCGYAVVHTECRGCLFQSYSIQPPPNTRSPSYSTAACPGVTEVWGVSKRTSKRLWSIMITLHGAGV